MRIIWSPRAIERIAEIAEYIAGDNPSAAGKWIDAIFDRVKTLEKFPEIGRMVPEANRKKIRELLFKSYRIIYRHDEEQISILTVRHGS
ncbi:type II toxin-antitoxin system RelE/ParE family toxin [candidate division KSB1 bacterium]|nr:type II toxin-antitoxin system RelE/ParE family toxin [candidate division KSB1 bacterium]